MWNEELENKLYDEVIPKLKQDIFELNDFMACNPELGSYEFESAARIVQLMRKYGLEVEYPFSGLETAFKGVINPGKGKKAAFLVEYDALPEIGHACGHCASGMASVLAGLALNHVKDELDIQIDIIGTPDEEMTGAKCHMANLHVFDGYDFAAMVHMGGINTVEVDFIALDGMTFQFKGRPAHAARNPQAGRNALNAARLLFDSVDMMRQHIIPEARIHGYIKNGGVASNIVPDFTEVEFLTRAPKREELSDITAWVQDCARAASLATRTEVKIAPLGAPYHELYISEGGRALLTECFEELDQELCCEKGSFVGSSDVGNVDYVCPAFQPIVSIGQKFDVHTVEFGEAMTDPRTHQAIVNGAKLLLKLTSKLYGDPYRLASIKAEHKAYRGY